MSPPTDVCLWPQPMLSVAALSCREMTSPAEGASLLRNPLTLAVPVKCVIRSQNLHIYRLHFPHHTAQQSIRPATSHHTVQQPIRPHRTTPRNSRSGRIAPHHATFDPAAAHHTTQRRRSNLKSGGLKNFGSRLRRSPSFCIFTRIHGHPQKNFQSGAKPLTPLKNRPLSGARKTQTKICAFCDALDQIKGCILRAAKARAKI